MEMNDSSRAQKPDNIYVIPPGRNLSSIDTHLRLSELEESPRARAPIDHLFRTLARTHDSKAVGIVLSGSGSDGAVGLKAIKEAGGLILAQDPTEAAFDSMPQRAIATGIVDDVLPVGEIAGRLVTYLSTEPAIVLPDDEELAELDEGEAREEVRLLQKIFAHLRTVTGYDFSRYKRGTVGRRLARRMQLHGLTTLEEYLDLLRAEPDEAHALFKDLLIVVTNFFRDPESFAVLAEEVIPRLFEEKGHDDELRVWLPGCATGEEAYSLAILLLEHAARLEERPAIQIFATDLSKEALAVGREGIYPEAIAADLAPERLARYFARTDGAYRVREELVRELEQELSAAKQELRAAVDEFESSKEEMRASNEELQSMNEKLRTTTEELETSKEELQSMNEELVAVNEENRSKVEELSWLTADLQNLLAATDIATLFLDRNLQIQRFTSAASDLFNIRHRDRNRPLAHLTHKPVGYDGLIADAERVLQTLAPVEQEVADGDGRRHFLRIRPYRTVDDRIDGVVITLVDITSLREAEHALARSRERYRLLVESAQEYAIVTADEEARINSWNAGARRILGYEEEEVLGEQVGIIFTPEDRASGVVRRELSLARTEGQAMNERWHMRKDGSRFWGSGVVTSLWDNDTLRGYAKVMRDNTARKEAEEALRESQERYRELVETLEVRVKERTEQARLLASELVVSEQRVRHRIARTLHDDLQQMLYAAEMQLQFLKEDADKEMQEGLEEVVELVTGSLRVTRQLTVELSPPVLKGEGLPEALEWLATQMLEVYGLQVTLEVSGQPQMQHEEQRILLFQMVRELLFNVVKHAGVRQAHVRMQQVEDGIELTVSDLAKGFDVEAVAEQQDGGFGLHSVSERLGLFGGRIEIDSEGREGTQVTVFLP